jgi:hypothetical protein
MPAVAVIFDNWLLLARLLFFLAVFLMAYPILARVVPFSSLLDHQVCHEDLQFQEADSAP